MTNVELERPVNFIPPREREEEKRDFTPDELKWLAGALEIGGSMGFTISKNRGTMESRPFISIFEADTSLTDFLKARYGGSKGTRGNTTFWLLHNRFAAEIMAAMQPYVVRRTEHTLAAYNFLQAESTDEKIQIAQDLRDHIQKQNETTEDLSEEEKEKVKNAYKKLVQDPAFVAGMLDHRGSIYSHQRSKTNKVLLTNIRSTNGLLIEALKEVHGGSLLEQQLTEQPQMIKGHEATFEKNSFRLLFTNASARRLVAFALPRLRVQPYEGWDIVRGKEREKVTQEAINSFAVMLAEELDSFGKGDIDRIKTSSELAAELKLSESALGRRLRKIPLEVRKKREEILRGLGRRVLTRSDVAVLQEQVMKEVQDFMDGKRNTITTNQELATSEHCDPQMIKIHVIRTLPLAIREARTRFLRSKATSENNKRRYANIPIFP